MSTTSTIIPRNRTVRKRKGSSIIYSGDGKRILYEDKE
jgi:hypothetical protein